MRAATLQPLPEPGYGSIKVALDGRPPPQGAVVALVSGNPARISVPSSVTIPPDTVAARVPVLSTPGPTTIQVPITATYNGITRTRTVYSYRLVKPDLVINSVVITDRFGNVITTAPDGQPVKVCTWIGSWAPGGSTPNVPVPASVFRLSYQTPTGTGTSTGRDVDLPVAFNPTWLAQGVTQCVDLPGLAPSAHHDVTLTLDFRNEVDEDRESNNEKTLRITRQ